MPLRTVLEGGSDPKQRVGWIVGTARRDPVLPSTDGDRQTENGLDKGQHGNT